MAFSQSLWKDAWQKIKKDKLALICVSVTLAYVLVAILVSLGLLASDWSRPVGGSYDTPSWSAWFGTDIFWKRCFK